MNGEVIFIQLFDVGRAIKLEDIKNKISGIKNRRVLKGKDTPEYFEFPETLDVEITEDFSVNISTIIKVSLEMRLYKDGVISIILRLQLSNYPLEKLHIIRKLKITSNGQKYIINNLIERQYERIYNQLKSEIEEAEYLHNFSESESYTIFTITDELKDPLSFIQQNKDYLAPLLMGENPEIKLHESQIENIFKNPESFHQDDLFIFDLDRCLIIDPNQNYEDVLQVIELANYQLLELRTFDRYLDSLLDKAEDDIRELFFKRRWLGRRIKNKFAYLFRLRYDMIFIWENLENVSKIIGDYFLSQIYNHLSQLFALDDWSDNIRQRLKVLDDIYSAAKYDFNERILILLEVMIVVLFIIDIILIIVEYF